MIEPIVEWTTPEHFHYDRSSDWYWAVGIVSVTAAVVAFILSDIIFGIFILIAASSLCIFASTRPRVIRCEINDRGIVVDTTLYPFLNIHSFWIDHLHPQPKILLKSSKFFMPYISVPIDEINPEDVRMILLRYIAEQEHHEAFTLKLLEFLGF